MTLTLYRNGDAEYEKRAAGLRDASRTDGYPNLPVCPSCNCVVSLGHNPVFTDRHTLHGTCAVWFLYTYIRELEAERDNYRKQDNARKAARIEHAAEQLKQITGYTDAEGKFLP
jgi:hypothetical protein